METNFRLEDGGEDRLWDYIDGISSPEEKTAIEKLLESNAEWRKKYRELLEVHELIHSAEMEEPSMRFTKNVMDEIARSQIAPATRTYINKNIIRGIAACFIALMLGFLIYGFGQVTVETGGDGGSSYMPDMGKLDFSKFFNNTYMNILLMINVILGLFLMDRYFSAKRDKYKKA